LKIKTIAKKQYHHYIQVHVTLAGLFGKARHNRHHVPPSQGRDSFEFSGGVDGVNTRENVVGRVFEGHKLPMNPEGL